jgi:putative transposase
MPRPLRVVDDGLIYHVINRGNNRQKVFGKAADFQAFLDALRDLKGRKPFRLYGYCLMSNHIHLLIQPVGDSISRIVQSLLVSHTQRYHKHHRSSGHVWQGRFKSPVIQSDEHLLTVLRQKGVRTIFLPRQELTLYCSHATPPASCRRRLDLPCDQPWQQSAEGVWQGGGFSGVS